MQLNFISEYFSIELFVVNTIFNLVCLNNLVMTFVSFQTYVNLTCFLSLFSMTFDIILFDSFL